MYQTGNKCYEEKYKAGKRGYKMCWTEGNCAFLQKVAREGHFRQESLEQNTEMRESCAFLGEEDCRQRGKANEKIKDGNMAFMFKEVELTACRKMAAGDESRDAVKVGPHSST